LERKEIYTFHFLHHSIRRVCKIAKNDNELRNVCIFFRPSALLSVSPSVTGHEFLYLSIFPTSVKKIQILLKFNKITNILCCMIMSCLLNFTLTEKCFRQMLERKSKQILHSKTFFRKSCRFLG